MSALTLHCIYASTSGNVEKVVETVAQRWRDLGWQVTLHRAEKTQLSTIQDNTHFLFATSTWEHGVLNPFFARLFNEMTKADFTGKQAAFIGLGDTRYEPVLFCEGMQIVRQNWLKNHGQEVGSALRINGEPYSRLETMVIPWADRIATDWTTHA